MDKIKVGVISLGCDKNRIDTEKMLYIVSKKYDLTNDIDDADVVIINTCAFLEASRKEAISEILSTASLKRTGKLKKLIVTGCLPQKFIDEIFDELTEVDGFLGVSDYDKINDVISATLLSERVNAVGTPKEEICSKRILTTKNYAYLKIADGCSNRCTYCLIPKIRGKFRSVPLKQLIDEAKGLGKLPELILVAQDVTRYGEDLIPKTNLVGLIRGLSKLKNIDGIRLLYCYPELVTDELIEEFVSNKKLIKYIDIPLQHADDKILKLMNRKGTGKSYLNLIGKLKSKVPMIAIRSTFITGFPNESDEAFNNLVEFIKSAKLFNAGFFKYSREKGTASYNLDGQIEESVKTRRLKKLYSVQKAVVKENYKKFIDKEIEVLAEGFDNDQLVYYGRAYFNAPDIDGRIYFFSQDEVVYGEKLKIKILKAVGYDLYGERV